MTLYFSYFALSCQPYLIPLCLSFKHFCFVNFKLDIKVSSLLINLYHFDPSFFSTPPLFLLYFLCSQLCYSSETLALALLHMYLLVISLIIFFLVAFIIELLLYLNIYLISSVLYTVFATLYIDI